MMEILNPVWAEINLDNLNFNINKIKEKVRGSKIIGIVKCDAYGHGAIEVSKCLIKNGVNKLAVANINEAIELRKNGIDCSIMILGITIEEAIDKLIEYNIESAVSTYDFAYKLSKKAKKLGKIAKINIALDTGMGRIGFRYSKESIEDIKKISELENMEICSIFSHFSSADHKDKEYCKFQIKNYNLFQRELAKYKLDVWSKCVANSATVIDMPEYKFDYVRPGIIEYGYYPSNEVKKQLLEIKPVLTWKTKIIHIKAVEENQCIGYGRKFKTKRKSIIATIPVGYGDGYSRNLSGKAKVIVNGHIVPVVGTICMDQCMIDVTDVENVNLHDEVVLLGKQGDAKFDAEDMADLIDSISYEVLCNIGRRVPRVYIEGEKIIKIKNYM
ncbi:alanine racemase [Clostridium niameyense]|uniref:alanine racemase n=1 Tax=Clostridium niameyense TaxID=1622073 RepID=UPI003C12C40C